MHDAKWQSNLKTSSFQIKLLKWFDDNRRDLPWRKNKTPYRIWVSEIMLQQTQVVTVVNYYRRFIKRFPTVKKLAAADQSDVLKLWEGLGYYRRARQMHAAAKMIVEKHSGRFPTDVESVLALPGIGRYTAAAILSISQDQRLPILEGNTIRLFARLLAMRDDPRASQNQKALWAFSQSLLPNKRCGDFNQALMELGSEICQSKTPQCGVCPIRSLCSTNAHGLQNKIPAAGRKLDYEAVDEAVVVVCRRCKYLVRLCGEGERWSGLWDFPRFTTGDDDGNNDLTSQLKSLTGLSAELRDSNQVIKHAVTRFRITLRCFVAQNIKGRLVKTSRQQFKWVTTNELADLPMSVTGRIIATRISDKNGAAYS